MKNIPIGRLIAVCFGIILFLFGTSLAITLVNSKNVNTTLSEVEVAQNITKYAHEMLSAENALGQAYLEAVIVNAKEIQPVLDTATLLEAEIVEHRKMLDTLLGETNSGMKEMDTVSEKLAPFRSQLRTIASDPNVESVEIYKLVQNEMMPLMTQACDILDKVVTDAEDNLGLLTADANEANDATSFLATLCTVVAAVVAIGVGVSLTRTIKLPVREVLRLSKEIAGGKLDGVTSYASKNEFGQMMLMFAEMQAILKRYIASLSGLLEELKNGNFSLEIEDKFPGVLQHPVDLAKEMLEKLNSAFEQIHRGSQHTTSASEQVSDGAQALAQGATEQAGSVQELANTLHRIEEAAKEGTVDATNSKEQIKSVAEEMDKMTEQVKDLHKRGNELQTISKKVTEIVKTIENIAFQTNILALNAAVEAARAGIAGKGFTVVADEVRNLASKSADASKQTGELMQKISTGIETTNKGIEKVTASVASTGYKLTEGERLVSLATEKIFSVTEHVEEASKGAEQISAVVQTNSATAEENAATSQVLSEQASNLKKLVGKFKLRPKKVS